MSTDRKYCPCGFEDPLGPEDLEAHGYVCPECGSGYAPSELMTKKQQDDYHGRTLLED